jgi:hypothetical protein
MNALSAPRAGKSRSPERALGNFAA